MKIAIIVPYRNAERWINRCIASIDSRFDIVLVNDDKLKVGAAEARNIGIKRSLALDVDYITFLDADDEQAPGAYDAMLAAIKEAPDSELIQFNHKRVAVDGVQMLRMPNKKGYYWMDKLPQLWVSSVNKLFKASLIKDIRFNPNLRHGEDEIFILECLKQTRAIYHSDYVTMIYHKDNPLSLSSITSFDDLIGEQAALLRMLSDNREDKKLCKAIQTRQAELWNNAVYNRVFGGYT